MELRRPWVEEGRLCSWAGQSRSSMCRIFTREAVDSSGRHEFLSVKNFEVLLLGKDLLKLYGIIFDSASRGTLVEGILSKVKK